MGPAGLIELPVELISHTLSYIADRPSLRNLAITSRKLHALATPRLYEHITLFDRGREHINDTTRQLRSLTALLLRRPDDRATLVRHVTLAQRLSVDYDAAQAEYEGRPVEGRLTIDATLEAAVRAVSADSEDEDRWIKELSWPRNDCAVSALLLSSVTSLQSLFLYTGISNRLLTMFARIGRRAPPFDVAPALQSLQWLGVSGKGGKYGIAPNAFAPLLRLPALRAVYCENVERSDDDGSIDEELMRLDQSSSKVTRLELADSVIHSGDMSRLLTSIRTLETFAWHVGVGELSCARTDFTLMRDGLEWFRETLHTVWLGNARCEYTCYMQGELIRPIKGFATFPQLKRLSVNPIFLFGFDGTSGDVNGGSNGGTPEPADPKPEWNDFQRRRLRGFLPPNCEVFGITCVHFRVEHTLKALADLLPARPASLRVLRLTGVISAEKCGHVCISAEKCRSVWPAYLDLARQARSAGVRLDLVDGREPYTVPRYKGSWAAVDRELWAPRGTGPGDDRTVYIDGLNKPFALVREEDLEQWIAAGARQNVPSG